MASRDRSRGSKGVTFTTDYRAFCTLGTRSTAQWVYEFLDYPNPYYSTIKDEVGLGPVGKERRFGNVYHHTDELTDVLRGPIVIYDGQACPTPGHSAYLSYHSFSDIGYHLDQFYDQGLNAGGEVSVDWEQLNAEAYLTMKPSLSSSFSLTNFLVELREFKTLFKFVDTSKSVSRNVGSGYLNYQFGWKLFVRDLLEIKDKLINMEKTLNDYKSKQGKVLVRHFAKSLSKDSGVELGNSTTYKARLQWERKQFFHATMRYRYTVPDIDKAHAFVKGALDIVGLRLDASVIWEAVPFSFVADWFFGIGDYLASLKTDYLESEVEILDYCCSYKHTVKEKYGIVFGSNYTSNYGGTINLLTRSRKWYSRKRMLPNAADFGVRLSDRYGSKQMLLSAALLHK